MHITWYAYVMRELSVKRMRMKSLVIDEVSRCIFFNNLKDYWHQWRL